jgi:DNA-binding IclR family transcriptional regulator
VLIPCSRKRSIILAQLTNSEKLETLFEFIRNSPGLRMNQVAERCRVYRSKPSFYRALARMEQLGMLLSEDQRGGLYTISRSVYENALSDPLCPGTFCWYEQ